MRYISVGSTAVVLTFEQASVYHHFYNIFKMTATMKPTQPGKVDQRSYHDTDAAYSLPNE
jgi:hypothetical protein